MDALIILSRFLHFAALAVLFGGSLFRFCVEPQQQNREHGWPPVDIAAAVAAFVSAVGWLIGVAATMVGDWDELLMPDTMAAVLLDTRFGQIWIGRLSLAVGMLGLLFAFPRRAPAWDMMILFMSAALITSLASVGHGLVGAGMLSPIHFAGDVIHLLSAAAWLGGLVGLALFLHRASKQHHSLQLVRTVVPTFSRLGYGAVAVLVMTGVLNTAVLMPRLEALITSAYGRVLNSVSS